MNERELRKFREEVKKVRARELRAEAIRARNFSGEETFKQGLDLIKLAMRIHEASRRCEK